jgi:hypothetical protein
MIIKNGFIVTKAIFISSSSNALESLGIESDDEDEEPFRIKISSIEAYNRAEVKDRTTIRTNVGHYTICEHIDSIDELILTLPKDERIL